ncbi:putative yir3 protein [Plasmodium yoelii yoelii]|uniref:Yir3 protein n=1 Tax=Plasmodium yoelii yoelii TaxID=73239 RepID=Q7R6W1_PLAYO|nr:putative yir3 protein [Plasmodium yoelii yoelii]
MNKEVCKKFQDLTTNLEYDSNTKNYKFKDDKDFIQYCTDGKCEENIDKINAVCLFLFNELFGNSTAFSFIAKGNTNIVEYIMILLSYMLNFKKIEENYTIKNFYEAYINNDNGYITDINNVSGYKNYKDLIDKKEDLMSIYVKDMSKFYYVFTLLCMMYVEFDEKRPTCYRFSEIAKEFAKKYDELNENYNNGKDSPYNKLLSTLSNDYCNLKNKCNDPEFSNFPSLPTYSRRLIIKRTLIPIAFIFVVVSIFFGIAYKQCLREKIKNIKKKLIINKLF